MIKRKKQFLPADYEVREITSKLETVNEEKKKILRGFIPYNSRSDHYNEMIAPGAFTKTLQERNVVALINHDSSKVLGAKANGTLSFEDSETGLNVIVELPDTSYARDAFAIIERGDVSTMSFGFLPVTTAFENGMDVLREVKLFEVSFMVTFPAYEETTSTAFTRSMLLKIKQTRGVDFEQLAELAAGNKKDLTADDQAAIDAGISLLQSLRTEPDPEPDPEPPEPQPSEDPDTAALEALEMLVNLESEI